jgi:hypothetical protein
MVWTAQQTGQFLDIVKDDRLYPLWHTFIFQGPRRGEMCALPWTEVSLTDLWLRISAQTVEVAYRTYGEAPKADSVRTVSMGLESAEVLREWKAKQQREREQWSKVGAWVESGLAFTHENGEPIHPDWVSRRFKRLVELSGLPPVRLRDARHISASLSLLAGNDIKVVQEKLGHSSRQITSDTYTSVLPELLRAEAESTLSVVPREVSYRVHQALKIPESAFRDGLAVLYAHAVSYGDLWAVGALLRHDGELLGEIRAPVRSPEQAAGAAEKWLRGHCTEGSLQLVRVENLHAAVPEDQRQHLTLVRFVIGRVTASDVAGWLERAQKDDCADEGPDQEAA